MGEVYSRLSEGERRVIQIEIGNGAGIRGIGLMPGRNASTAGGRPNATRGSRPTRTGPAGRAGRNG